MACGVRLSLCVCDALIDRQIVHIYHVKFNIVNKNMRIHILRGQGGGLGLWATTIEI